MSKVTLRRDELVAEAAAIYSAAPGSAVIADMMADFAMMIAARVAVRMTPPEAATLRASLAAATAREVRLREAIETLMDHLDSTEYSADGWFDAKEAVRAALKEPAP